MHPVTVLRDLVYSHAGGKPRLADVYLPAGVERPLPVILWVHGGGWRFGDRHLGPDFSRWFAERGFAMVSFDYRLSEEVIFPDPVMDVQTAVRWVRSVAPQYGLDPEAIALWGSSAGSQLSACAALAPDLYPRQEHQGFGNEVQCVVTGYIPTDFTQMDAGRTATPPRVLDAETVKVKITVPTAHPDSFESRHIGVPVGEGGAAVTRANPVTYVHPGAPPFLLLHGESDGLVPWTQSRLLFTALAATGNDATLITFERLGHGFFNNSDLDARDAGEATITVAGQAKSSTTHTLGVFEVCERFFRTILIERAAFCGNDLVRPAVR